MPQYTNRLVDASSPYLRQHAHNPVDWYPWGEEAFDRARQEDKPVFLSIGYSTCHWCHVMERESFENEEIAAFLRQHFVSIKLDREQRPDLDDIYMTGVQMLTGQGGWPMSNFLTPDGKPFFAGTYYPAANFLDLLRQIATVWRDRRGDVEKQANEIADSIARFTAARADASALPDDLCHRASEELLARFDEMNGGFGGAPKFPNESSLLLLAEDATRNDNRRALQTLTLTLDKMSQGGIYDQICGGFHRYTVDAVWLVPHFEKMLYNQAQLLRVYAAGYARTRAPRWRRVIEQTVAYVLRDMTDAGGAFYSATDADSEGEEGLFFLWTPDELDAALAPDDAAWVKALYDVSAAGNFEGRNILHLPVTLSAWAAQHDTDEAALAARLGPIHEALYRVRESRVHPLRDEKIITAWNGLMITGLATAGFELGRADYLEAATRAAEFLWTRARDDTGELWRISFEGGRSIRANLEDYAYLAEALLNLHRFGAGEVWLERARELVGRMLTEFRDAGAGGFFLSRQQDEGPLITRPKSPMDGAVPSANSVALMALVLLYEVTGDAAVQQSINETLAAFGGLLAASPSSFAFMVGAAERYRNGARDRVQFAAGGHVRVAWIERDGGSTLSMEFAEGWHINGHDIADATLVATRVQAAGARVRYPTGDLWSAPCAIEIDGDVPAVTVTLQGCSGELCLAPQTLTFA